jgi:hypothetical protein
MISIILVTIIAAFFRIQNAITTHLWKTSVRTTITTIQVAIVTGLKAQIAIVQISTNNAITATSRLAVRRTSIVVVGIAVIAGFEIGILG